MKRNGQYHRLSLDPLRKRIEHYTYSINQKLGSGYSSQVFRGRDDRNGKTVAIKVVNMQRVREKGHVDLLMREIQLLQEMKHPNMVTCLDALMTNNNCYIVTEYCADGDLSTLLARRGRLGVDEALQLIHQVVAALTHLHHRGVIHRDIKPQNILMHNNRPKLADLGFAIQCETSVRDGYKIGSPLYMSPQALQMKEYSRKSDVWSLGVTMFQILEGRAPWPVKAENELRSAVTRQIEFKHLKHAELSQLIRGCLVYDRESRLTTQQILIRLQKMMGLGDALEWSCRSNKQNTENNNNGQCLQQSEQVKKDLAVNYSILKWMINYSRFAAKLLPKLQQAELQAQTKEPIIQFIARCLHMTISKLKRVDQFYSQLNLASYEQFKRTHRFAKIKAVTDEYHQKYLMLLVKLPYRYSLSNSLALELSPTLTSALERITISRECSQESLKIAEGALALVEANLWAQNNALPALSQMTNFEKLIECLECQPQDKAIQQICVRRVRVLSELRQSCQHA